MEMIWVQKSRPPGQRRKKRVDIAVQDREKESGKEFFKKGGGSSF